MTEDYELPIVEEIVASVLKGIVPEDKIGVNHVETFERFADLSQTNYYLEESDFDFILLKRRSGYLTDAFTDIAGVDITCFAVDRNRALKLSNEVTKRLFDAETNTFDGWTIDFVQVLSGPEEDIPLYLEDRVIKKTFEIHIRVKWR